MKLAQQLRLIWIEGRARTTGHINRAEICAAWQLSLPQATKDLVLFTKLHPGCLRYNVRAKRYEYLAPRKAITWPPLAVKAINDLADYIDPQNYECLSTTALRGLKTWQTILTRKKYE